MRVRMAPSPTGAAHIGTVRTFLYNWLFARQQGGECLLRIENTDTSREVAEAAENVQRDLAWLGIDWDGDVTFQLDRMDECRDLARRLVDEGAAYEDEGAVRFRMPDDGDTGWDDVIRGRVEVPNATIEDVVLVRSDGRPTYNFASPAEDMLDGITHVIRASDHISNTPKQIRILEALGAAPPTYAHVPMVLGPDGKKLSKRHGADSVADFRHEGYVPPALMNFLARLGWAADGRTEIFSRDDLVELFRLDRVSASPGVFDHQKLLWLNGVYLRAMPPQEYAQTLTAYLRDEGYDWDDDLVRRTAPLVQEKIARLGEYPQFAGFFFRGVDVDGQTLDGVVLAAAEEAISAAEPFETAAIEESLRAAAARLDLSPRKAFQPIRVAVTGSTVSPGLFETLELLGRDESLARIRSARAAGA